MLVLDLPLPLPLGPFGVLPLPPFLPLPFAMPLALPLDLPPVLDFPLTEVEGAEGRYVQRWFPTARWSRKGSV